MSTSFHLPTQVDGWAGYSSVLDQLHYKDTRAWISSIKSIYGIQEWLPSRPKKQIVTVTLRDRLCSQIHGIRELQRSCKKATFPSQQSTLTHVEACWVSNKDIGQQNVTQKSTRKSFLTNKFSMETWSLGLAKISCKLMLNSANTFGRGKK